MKPAIYQLIALFLTFLGFGLGIVFYYRDVGNYSYLVTVGSSNTQVYVQTPNTLYSIAIFICGAVFSTGLSMLFASPKSDNRRNAKGRA